MNTLLATIKFDQIPEVGDDLSAKIYKRQQVANNEGEPGRVWYAVSVFCNEDLQQCLGYFASYEAACAFAFEWVSSGVGG